MKKITITDFSGGIQESMVPDDFTSRQWAQLKGIIPSDMLNFESQWPMQTVGSGKTNLRAVYPLTSTTGTYLVGLTTSGVLTWCKVPATNATFTTANATSWTDITVAANKGYNGSNITLTANTTLKFLCPVPLQVYKYVTTPDPTDLDNPSKDTVDATTVAQTSSVLINSTTTSGVADSSSHQVLIAYVDNSTNSIKVIKFPNLRRFPMHDKEAGDFIKAYVGDDTYVSMPDWVFDAENRGYHPYLYLDINAALLPGTGVIPRANVGTMKGGTLLLGDIEWRSDLTTDTPSENYVEVPSTTGLYEFANAEYQLSWPSTVPDFSRVVFPYNGPVAYFKDDSNMVGTISNYALFNNRAYFWTDEAHGYTVGETVDISRISGSYNGTYEIVAVDNTHCFAVDKTSTTSVPKWSFVTSYVANGTTATITTLNPHGFVTGDTISLAGVATALEKKDHVITGTPTNTSFTFATTHTVALTTPPANTAFAALPAASIISWSGNGTTATFTTGATHSLLEGETVFIKGTVTAYNGPHVITGVPTGTTFTIASSSSATNNNPTLYGVFTSPVGRSVCYDYRVDGGAFQGIPNSWTQIWTTADEAGTKVRAVKNLNTATHLLNDFNTGPHRGSIYFSTGYDIDMFDPRGVLKPSQSDVHIAGMHTLDDTVIIITTAGSQGDGVYRLRGRLERVIQYGEASDPTAVRIELIRGGIGAPARTTNFHNYYSTVWSEAGVVVFIDRLGGVWYTNGQDCDRLDRFGPKAPRAAVEADHVAEVGKSLFLWRDGRLLCLTMMDSASDGRSGSACWTEVSMPTGSIQSMIGGGEQLFFVRDGRAIRMVPQGLDAERARFDNVPLEITVSTLTAGEVGSHARTNWHRFGMTFATPTSCTIKTIRVQSTGALRIGTTVASNAVFPDVQHKVTLNRTYNNPGILGEFIVPAGIGPQAMCSATVSIEGYIQLQSASFWITGQQPRVGDL